MPAGRLTTAAVVAVSLALQATAPARADMAAQMSSMFTGMVNISPPGAYDTQRRGEISGGGVAARSRIVNANLVAFNPPSFRAGCGGIDFFAGSFSFINAEQFTQLMQAVASNAVGYAFNLALDQMCPQCMRTIETLQRKIQELNQHFGNSCQLAQGIVNDGWAAISGKRVGEASMIRTFEGIGDIFQSWTSTTGESPTESINRSEPTQMQQRLEGNLTWRALKEHGVDGWFNAGGDDEVLSVMMTIAGTIIVDYDDTTDEFTHRVIAGRADLLESWIEGAPTSYYSCVGQGPDGCLNPTTATSTWHSQGFARAIFNRLTDPTNGVIQMIRGMTDPAAADRRLIVSIPGRLGAMFVRLSAISDDAAIAFARAASYQMALELTASLLRDLHSNAAAATDGLTDAATAELKALLAASEAASRGEIARLQREHGSVVELLQTYEGYLNVSQPNGASIIRARLSTI
jgi:conjugative transfer pilus assembly protein TraH